jgi:folylpolyglutamate synthase/dihydropteroate synthase
MEIVSTKPLVIVDFAHTPDGMDEVLKSFPNKEIISVYLEQVEIEIKQNDHLWEKLQVNIQSI